MIACKKTLPHYGISSFHITGMEGEVFGSRYTKRMRNLSTKNNKKDMFVSSVLLDPGKDIEKVNLEEETFWFI